MSCLPIVYPPCPQVECPDVNPVDLSNGNLSGVGVLDSFAGQAGIFRGITGDGQYISTTLNAGNLAIEVSLISANIAAAVPQATETVAGKAEFATQPEVDAGTAPDRIVSPLTLENRAATTTSTGLIELATQAEVDAGANSITAVVPSTLAVRLATIKATTTWANAAARAAAAPAFDGQVGVQLDTEVIYTGTGLAAGNWQQTFIQANTITTFTADTTFHTGAATTFALGAIGVDYFEVGFDAGPGEGFVNILNDAWLNIGTNSRVVFGADTTLDLATTSLLKIAGTEVPGLSLLGTTGTAGRPTSYTQASFLGAHSLVAWAIPTGTADRTTFDTATVTLPELAERFFALLEDLNNLSIPSY